MQPWGLITYVHNTSQKRGKLALSGKTCIFVRYFEHSKCYVFFGKQLDGTIAGIESRDADFFEKNFPSRSNVSEKMNVYEMEEDDGSPDQIVKTEEISRAPIDSESDIPLSSSLPSNKESHIPHMLRSERENIPLRHYEIEGNTFVAEAHDDKELTSILLRCSIICCK